MLKEIFTAFTQPDPEAQSEMTLVMIDQPQPLPFFPLPMDKIVGYLDNAYIDDRNKDAPGFVQSFDSNADGELVFIPKKYGDLAEKILASWKESLKKTTKESYITEQGGLMALKSTVEGTWIFFVDGECGFTPLRDYFEKAGQQTKHIAGTDTWDQQVIMYHDDCHVFPGNLVPDRHDTGAFKTMLARLKADVGYSPEEDEPVAPPPAPRKPSF